MAIGDKKSAVMQSDLAIAGGVATLDSSGKLVQMPTYTDVNAAPAGFGWGTTSGKQLTSDDDLNNITKIGFYNWHSGRPANAPSSFSKMLVWTAFGSYITQMINTYSDSARDKIYIRSNIGGNNWSDWKIIYSRDELLNDFVKKDGDTMTGALTISNAKYPKIMSKNTTSNRIGATYVDTNGGYNIQNLNLNDDKFTQISIMNETTTLGSMVRLFVSNANNTEYTTYSILHTGNKPSGSYTGNAAVRTINVGGIGRVLCLQSGNGIGFIAAYGAIFISNTGVVKYFNNNVIRYGYRDSNGIIEILSDEANQLFNYNGVSYSYQVL